MPFLGTMLGDYQRARPVATIAALKALGTVDGDVVFVAAYSTAGDGGGGHFRFNGGSSATANNGTIVAPDVGGGRWERVFTGPINVRWFGAKGDNITDDTVAMQAAADAAEAAGSGLVLPPVVMAYRVSNTLDLKGIRVIDGRGAKIAGNFEGKTAVEIGGVSAVLRDAHIALQVLNDLDKSITANTVGVALTGSIDNSKMRLDIRGFDVGLLADGVTGRSWVGNRIEVADFFNNGTHVFIRLAGDSYFIANQFVGGSYYIGANQLVAGRATFKLEVSDTGLASEIVVDAPEIGIKGDSVSEGFSALLAAAITTSQNHCAIRFENVRLETYNSLASPLYFVNVTNLTSQLAVHVHFQHTSTAGNTALVSVPASQKCNLVLTSDRNSEIGTTPQRRVLHALPFLPVEAGGYVTVAGYTLFDTAQGDITSPVERISASSGRVIAPGNGRLISKASSGAIVGRTFIKHDLNFSAMLRLNARRMVIVICYDASGAVLSGSSPQYVQGAQCSAATVGNVGVYRAYTNWVWIHPDVASFFIGEAAWSATDDIQGIAFEVTFGPRLREINQAWAATLPVVHANTVASHMPVGTALAHVGQGVLMATAAVRTTLASAASSGATDITVTSATGIAVSDRIVVEISSTVYHATSVSAVAGSVVTLAAGLPADAAISASVRSNRWVLI